MASSATRGHGVGAIAAWKSRPQAVYRLVPIAEGAGQLDEAVPPKSGSDMTLPFAELPERSTSAKRTPRSNAPQPSAKVAGAIYYWSDSPLGPPS